MKLHFKPTIRYHLLIICGLIPALLHAQKPIDHSKQIDTVGQKDIIDVARAALKIDPANEAKERNKSFYFSFLPVSSSGPGTGEVLVTSTTAGFYLGNHNTTYLSNITFAPYFNFLGRYGLPFRSEIWTDNNGWVIQGDTRFMIYPQFTWGLGGNQPNNKRILLDYKLVRVYQSALKRITSYFYAGAGYNLDDHLDIESPNHNIGKFTGYKYGTLNNNSSVSSGGNVSLLYDTRNNAINPMPGFYGNVVYRVNTTALGSNTDWQSLYIDLRKYVSLTNGPEKNMLAFWTYYWTDLNGRVPYLDLPSIGWDSFQRSGRGIPQNRYRGKGLVYGEGEYRRDLTDNGLLGFVLFSNVDSVTEPITHDFTYWHLAGGGGLRLKFNKNSNTNIALDYGVSQGFSQVRFNLGEAF